MCTIRPANGPHRASPFGTHACEPLDGSTLIGSQQVIRGLGIVGLDLTAPIAAVLPPLRRNAGAVVARVTPETPYSQQGRLQPGDVVYALNGRAVGGAEELKKAAGGLAPGAAAVLLIERGSVLMYLAFRAER